MAKFKLVGATVQVERPKALQLALFVQNSSGRLADESRLVWFPRRWLEQDGDDFFVSAAVLREKALELGRALVVEEVEGRS